MIFGELVGISFLTFVLLVWKNNEENITQETCPHRGSNPGPLRDSAHATACSTAQKNTGKRENYNLFNFSVANMN